jgi:sugar lactone lactonase YvrE
MKEPEHFLSVQNKLGESPIWEPEEDALYWVDWGGGPLYRFELGTGKCDSYPVSVPFTALARRAAGGMIAIAQTAICGWTPATHTFTPIAGLPEPDKPTLHYNDSSVDRQGRLLVGAVDEIDPWAALGSLWRLDPDESMHKLDDQLTTPNGIGLSPDGKTLYVTNMRNHEILVYDYDTTAGTASHRRQFVHVPADEGLPDGLTVDAEGFVWSGHWDGWRLTRYDPDGKIERQVRFPVNHVICFAFGGNDLADLYVTTAWWGFTDEERKKMPLAGDLFLLKPGVKGLVEPAFAG